MKAFQRAAGAAAAGRDSWRTCTSQHADPSSSSALGEPSTQATLTSILQKFSMCQEFYVLRILKTVKSIRFRGRNEQMQIIPVWIEPSVGVCDKTFVCFSQCLFHCVNIKYASSWHKDDFFFQNSDQTFNYLESSKTQDVKDSSHDRQ